MPGWMMPAPHENAPLGKFERLPGDGEGAYKTGHYRDLFAEQGHTPAETHAKIEKAFQQLFHGDGQEERVYFETGANENGTLAYMTDWANNDARTEGMSYGMMICRRAQQEARVRRAVELGAYLHADHRPEESFGGVLCVVDEHGWNAALDGRRAGWGRVLHDGALFCGASLGQWQGDLQLPGGGGQDSARHAASSGADGDGAVPDSSRRSAVCAAGSSVAEPEQSQDGGRGDGGGKADAGVFRFARGRSEETIGPMVDEDHNMIKFVPNSPGGMTDASYHLPAFYELWARWGPVEDRVFLGDGGGCEPRLVQSRDRAGDGADAGPEQL